jgi:hypothetical protein
LPTPVSGSSPNINSAALPVESPSLAPSPPAVTIPPVHIEGDAGKQELLKRHAAGGGAPDCRLESLNAAVGSVPIGAAVLSTLAAVAAGPIGVAAGIVGIFGASIYEGKELRALHDCRKP